MKKIVFLLRASGANESNELTSLINAQKYSRFCVARNSLKQKPTNLSHFLPFVVFSDLAS